MTIHPIVCKAEYKDIELGKIYHALRKALNLRV